jgi:hypothetical protein
LEASLGKKVPRTPSQSIKKLEVVAHACYPSYTGSINRKVMVQDSPGKNVRTYLKNIKKHRSLVCGSNGRVPAWQALCP